jgi:hypothetical protein
VGIPENEQADEEAALDDDIQLNEEYPTTISKNG